MTDQAGEGSGEGERELVNSSYHCTQRDACRNTEMQERNDHLGICPL